MAKSVSSASTLIRGGQTAQHWWRMGWQVLKFATVVGAAIYIAGFIFLVARAYDPSQMRIAFYYEMAERGIESRSGFDQSYTFESPGGQIVTTPAIELYRNPTYRRVRDDFFYTIHHSARLAVLPALVLGALSLLIFARTGNKIQEDEFVRGAKLVTYAQLKSWSNTKWKSYNKRHKGRKTAKPLTISGIPFPPDAVEAQTMLNGTVGVGKTNAMIEMLSTIRENGGKVIIYDKMGGFVSRFYDPETDVLINPFDDRSSSWNPFDDVLDAASFSQLGEVMIPEHRGAASDPFWSQSARIVFDYAARAIYQRKKRTVKCLIDYLLHVSAEELAGLLQGSPASHFFNEEIIKTAQSIRANLISELRFLEYLREDAARFSIREWMQSDKPGFLFLTGDAEHAAATRNIISTMLEISANALMSMGPATEPRCYYFMDEVPTLNRLPFLISSLAEIRQFGGAFVLGYQVYSQLEDIYGREGAQTISGTVNNRIVFNTPDFRTAKLCSEMLGNQDKWESNTNISVGAHEARDGVGFTQQRTERAIITPAEIQSLPQHEAAVKFAYDSPTALVKMKQVFVEETQPRFLPYLGNAPGFGGYDDAKPSQKKKEEVEIDLQTIRKFHQWCGWRFGADAANYTGKETAPDPDYKIYFPHFLSCLRAGTHPEQIYPVVPVGEGLARNAPAIPAPAPDHNSRSQATDPFPANAGPDAVVTKKSTEPGPSPQPDLSTTPDQHDEPKQELPTPATTPTAKNAETEPAPPVGRPPSPKQSRRQTSLQFRTSWCPTGTRSE